MRTVCNSGPLIHLARAGYFELLRLLFGRIVIPPAVYHEVVVRGRGQDGARELEGAAWILRRIPRRKDLITALGAFLALGEAEAIALASERRDTLLLIDEAQGRRVAERLGIPVRGSLGVLLQGYRSGHVTDLEGAIARMRERGTWIDDEVVAAVLTAAREGGLP